jgi:hypothetical protein
MDDRSMVNGFPLPPLLVSMMATGHWRHPGDEVLRAIIPFLHEPVDFLTIDSMRWESRGSLADNPHDAAIFHEARGTRSAAPVELPWLDVDKAIFIAINRFPGDDLGIALDYRTRPDDPRVVASEWLQVTRPWCKWLPWLQVTRAVCIWREVTGTFTEFVRKLGLGSDV